MFRSPRTTTCSPAEVTAAVVATPGLALVRPVAGPARAVRTAARLTPCARARAAIEVPCSRYAVRASSAGSRTARAGGRYVLNPIDVQRYLALAVATGVPGPVDRMAETGHSLSRDSEHVIWPPPVTTRSDPHRSRARRSVRCQHGRLLLRQAGTAPARTVRPIGWSTRWLGQPCCCTGSAGRCRSDGGSGWSGMRRRISRTPRGGLARQPFGSAGVCDTWILNRAAAPPVAHFRSPPP
jgi:hypothetical protein